MNKGWYWFQMPIVRDIRRLKGTQCHVGRESSVKRGHRCQRNKMIYRKMVKGTNVKKT